MDRRIQSAIRIIHDELHCNLQVSQLAKRVNLSRSHFIHLFSEEMEVSPKRYIQQCRIRRAKDLLGESFLTVKEIAARIGIDRSHFSRTFKELAGPSHLDIEICNRDADSTVFTPDEVRSLNACQRADVRHPYTCIHGRRADHLDGKGILVATERGWTCPYCEYTQVSEVSASPSMKNWQWTDGH